MNLRLPIFFLLYYLLAIKCFAQNYPTGFSQTQVVTGISVPSVYDFAPDGRIFIAQQDGVLRVYKNGALLSTPAITLDVLDIQPIQESGLVGIAVHPHFEHNNYVYLYYTTNKTGTTRNRISRFTFSGDIINPSSEQLILELDAVDGKIHNGGFMKFTQDEKLIVSIGDSNGGVVAQDLNSYLGKILRLNPDGTPPNDNPFATSSSQQGKRIWALGFRNPFTFDIDPQTGKLFVNDVGQATWEEINDATNPGLNFGWPANEGVVAGTTFTNPLFTYEHNETQVINGCAISGGCFFRPGASNYPGQYFGKYFFMDYCKNWIRYLDPSNPTSSPQVFATNIPSTSLSLKMGPDGNLYFLSRQTGSLYKIAYSLNSSPSITEQPQSTTIAVNQSATFHVAVAGVPPFTYQWKKGGTPISGATTSSYAISSAQISDAGNYTVEITNASGNIESETAILTVKNTTPPVATIHSPTVGSLYKGGDIINFSGSANDAEDGELPASAFTWYMEFWHGTGSNLHVHDGPPIAAGVKSGTYQIPVSGETATDVYYRIILIVEDSEGISNTKSIDINLIKATVSLATDPPGLKLFLDNQPRSTPLSFESVAGIEREVGVIYFQNMNGVNYKFNHWSHGATAMHTLSSPPVNTTYTAVFLEDNELRNPENPQNVAVGVNYDYYEGDWLVLPDFNSLTPKKSEIADGFSLGDRDQDTKFAFVFKGFIDIAEDGVYKFFTNSNDGSKLFIGNKLIVDNDGQHAAIEKSGTIGLKAGKHAIRVEYFQYIGGSLLQVRYSAVGLTKQNIPSSKLYHATSTTPNISPNVSIVTPSSNQQLRSISSVKIFVNAWDADGTISKVEFYHGTTLLGEDNTYPYEFDMNLTEDGSYSIYVKAYDNENEVSISENITFTVTDAVITSLQKKEKFELNVYPNPSFGDFIILSFKNLETYGDGLLKVISMDGKLVYSQKISCYKDCDLIINHKLNRDTYLLVTEIGNKVFSETVIVK